MRPGRAKNVAIVIGSEELGSATAVALHEAGFGVVLCDEVDPSGLRRGMSFTDAWYVGSAVLAGVRATFCASVRSIPTVLAGRRTIAATTWSWRGVAMHLAPAVIVDARCRPAASAPDLVTAVPPGALTIGTTPWYVARENAAVAIWPELRDAAGGTPAWDPLAADSHRKLLSSLTGGRLQTLRRIGDRVHAGEVLGIVGVTSIIAPTGGVLSGLASRGSRIAPGAPVAEVDSRGEAALCFGTPEWCARIAGEIVQRACQAKDAEQAAGYAGAVGRASNASTDRDQREVHT